MKTTIALVLSLFFAAAVPQKAKASDIATSVVVGVVVTHYGGTLAGIAASALLAGAATAIHSQGKEAVAQAAMNDIQNYYLDGQLSLALENSISSLKELDSDLSDEDAIDLILESLN